MTAASTVSDHQASPPEARSTRRTWWAAFLLLAGLGVTWAIATPTFASPDEPSQVIRAWSAAHGQWIGREFDAEHVPAGVDLAALPHAWDYGIVVRAPAAYRHWGNIGCLAYNAYATADCLQIEEGGRDVDQVTYHARYFPAYYFLAGLPSLVTDPGTGQVIAMRLVGVFLAAALLASAVASTRATRRPIAAATGFALALTPTALFLAASVNPSGIEIAAAIAVWCSGALLTTTLIDSVDARVLDRLGIASLALVLARPISPLWLALAGALLAVVAGTSGLRMLWASRRVRVWGGVIAAATLVHVAWNLARQAYAAEHYAGSPTSLPLEEVVRTSVDKAFDLVRQMIATFGWLDTDAPKLTIVVWLLALGGVVALAVVLTPRRWTYVLGTLTALVVVLPIVLEAWQVRDVGFQWQGRYTLPLAVGLPVLAAFALAQDVLRRIPGRLLFVVVGGALALAQLAAFVQALRRYSVGAQGRILFFLSSTGWSPPVPALVLVLAHALLLVVFFALLFLHGSWSRARERDVAAATG